MQLCDLTLVVQKQFQRKLFHVGWANRNFPNRPYFWF